MRERTATGQYTTSRSLVSRLESFVYACWGWLGARSGTERGRPSFWNGKKNEHASRAMWRLKRLERVLDAAVAVRGTIVLHYNDQLTDLICTCYRCVRARSFDAALAELRQGK